MNHTMDLVSRLKLFLNQNNIPVTQFADKCNIPRPTVSQIVNGRNKKISDEIVSKIHQAFPNLSIYWLMFGEGDMFCDSVKEEPSEINSSSSLEGNIFAHLPEYNGIIQREKFKNDKNEAKTSDIKAIKDNLSSNTDKGKINKNSASAVNERTIAKIVVFYSDNSFESFSPNNSAL